VKKEFSAGGVVVRDRDVVVITPVKRALNGSRVLGLPKGHLDGDETPEEAALREVREETGVQAELIEKLGEIRYQFDRKRATIDKTVAFFLFEYRSGSVADHDHEIEEARWMPLEEAVQALTHPAEREIVTRALSLIPPDR
jgi:mutator protein MutT